MKRKICLFLTAVLFACLICVHLAACQNGIAGTYQATYNDNSGSGISFVSYTATLKLKSNKKFTASRSSGGMSLGTDISGTYKVSDKTITFYYSYTVGGVQGDQLKEEVLAGTITSGGNIKVSLYGDLTYKKVS